MSDLQTATACPICGSVLSRERGSEGLCLSCLMELALESPSLMDEIESSEEAPTLDFAAGRTFSEGQVLGKRYRIRALLGRGGMGEVWRAVDLKLRVDVALKALRIELLADERALETLRQEVRMAREVISPNVCRVFDLVEIDGQELVSMEYIDGITLLDILKMRAPLDLTEAREIAAQFLAGLEAIHESGLVHRDVKPENLMMTRSGRMVLMDFGIAKGLAEGKTGTVAGTPAYMAPEQSRGEAPDARADVFSAGVVLAEMIAPSGLGLFEARQAIWQGIHQQSPVLPESPWAPVLRKAVARLPQQRYASASALARALEEVTLRVDRAEDVKPYPGLASFSQEEAKYFYGRELEVEEMWKKLRRPQLYGLIGPSGAGKSSFLRAGLLPVTPTGWRTVVTSPGNQPFPNLARALVAELSGDTEALQLLVDAENPESMSKVVGRWRQQHDQVVLMLDQFEELFTLNPPEVQERFAGFLARLALEADAHVLLSMRDDFLFYCSAQPALSPMFSELTPLRAPSGTALRRAVVQPALKCGYRFEDESLVGEMVEEVSRERGALPMLAFAAARLWEHRDREQGLLTREAYEHIGGVAGALAQHAEQTLERIGQDHIPIVRELFRNLVTAQGTRAARTREELLSVFGSTRTAGTEAGRFDGGEGSEIAEQVLNTLIDARLLTSYELPAENDEDSPQQRIEIIHESLLANWPRLVRWQTQDADSAQLRDQIRQVAQMWEEGGRPEDLLWTGTSYDEYQLWRERYSGGLSTAEESFTTAMTAHAERRKRLRRGAIAAVITVLVIGLGIVGTFWRQAVAASQRAEANQLLALGRLEIENNPTGAVAYALASLERADDPVTRLFALEALWRGPTALVLGGYPGNERLGLSLDFSPDGKWLVGGQFEGLQLWSSTGGAPRLLDSQQAVRSFVRFGPDSDLVVSQDYGKDVVEVRSVPDGRLVRTLPTQGQVDFRLAENPARIFTFTQQGSRARVEAWPLTGGGPEPFGNLESNVSEYSRYHFAWNLNLDPTGTRIVYVPHFDADERQGSTEDIYLVELADKAQAPPKLVGSHEEGISRATFHPDGEHLASADTSGEVRIWDLEAGAESPARVLHQPPAQWVRNIRFDPTGSRLATATWSGFAAMWDLEGPPDADPLLLRRGETGWTIDAAFHPEGRWLATASHLGVAIWPIAGRYPLKLNGHERAVRGVAFLPDSERLASVGADGTLRLWPLSAAAGDHSRVLLKANEDWLIQLAVDPSGRHMLASSPGGSVWLVPLDDTPPRELKGFDRKAVRIAVGRRRAAAIAEHSGTRVLRVWDLETGEFEDLETGSKIRELRFTPDDHMISAGPAGIRTWNFADGSFETLSESVGRIDFTRDWSIDFSRDGRLLLVGNQGDNGEAVLYDLGAETSLQLDSHGPSRCGKLDPAGKFAVTRPCEGPGYLQVGPVSGGPVHLLVSQDPVSYIAISPDGKWIASLAGDQSHTIHLWPVPDLAQPPLHTLPLDQLLAKLRTLTNLRVVEDPESTSGWNWGLDPFPGWEEMPTW